MTLTISKKGWVVIPVELRRKYDLTPGKTVQIVDYGGVLALVPTLNNPIQESFGMLAQEGHSMTKTLLEEHIKERERGR